MKNSDSEKAINEEASSSNDNEKIFKHKSSNKKKSLIVENKKALFNHINDQATNSDLAK